MNLSRREFSSILTAAVVAGFPLGREATAKEADNLYNVPKKGNVHLLHTTIAHSIDARKYHLEPLLLLLLLLSSSSSS